MPYVSHESAADQYTHLDTERFYGFTENAREVDMDMKEMVQKVKAGESLYGTSKVSPYLQGVAARNSRFSELFIHVLPWANVVNHDQVRSSLRSISLLLDQLWLMFLTPLK